MFVTLSEELHLALSIILMSSTPPEGADRSATSSLSRIPNQTQEAQVYSHGGPIEYIFTDARGSVNVCFYV